MPNLSEETHAAATAFLAEDPDNPSRAALAALIAEAEKGDAPSVVELEESFAGTLSFGTAGLRGKVAPGTNRMNRVVVMKATWGLGTYLLERGPTDGFDATKAGVVVGFDGRRTSRQFAEDAAGVLGALGIPVHVFDVRVPTPVCAYAVEHLNAAAGVMVTASHNPPLDNGYKVYWGNAAQIIPPHDKGIAACIAKAPSIDKMERVHLFDAAEKGLRHAIGDDVIEPYFQKVKEGLSPRAKQAPIRVVYTAMHGVGHPYVMRSLADAGFDVVAAVPDQADPDGAFPTVAFPNPEEPGALDRSFAVAKEVGADLIIANDPDADRLAVAIRKDDTYVSLSGNEVGAILGADALEQDQKRAASEKGQGAPLVITTLVSSTMLARMAKNFGAEYAETLTGFKWIANTAMERNAKEGTRFLFGFEEALGYSVGPLVKDKDGVSAAAHLVAIASELLADGKTLLDRLDDLEVEHGVCEGGQWSVVLPGEAGKRKIAAAMESLRAQAPDRLDGSPVVEVTDLLAGTVVRNDEQSAATMPKSNVLVFKSEDGTRLTVRPSGTEPKIKMYLEATSTVSDKDALQSTREGMREKLVRIRSEVDARLKLVPNAPA